MSLPLVLSATFVDKRGYRDGVRDCRWDSWDSWDRRNLGSTTVNRTALPGVRSSYGTEKKKGNDAHRWVVLGLRLLF